MDDLEFYRYHAARGKRFRGLTVLGHADMIGALIRDHQAQTLLDFGSGAGDQYKPPFELHKRWGVALPTLYDPAFPSHAVLPAGQFDGVLCSDVLEHLPEADVPAFIGQLFSYARLFVWASVCCRPARKTFPDGRNVHLTVRPFAWWHEQFQSSGTRFILEEAA